MSKTFSILEIPTVHLNGTSGEDLLEQITEAGSAAFALLKALERAAPNGRDYYVQGPDSLKRAEAEHRNRASKVKEVLSELERIAEGIAEQIERRG